jgi:predicted RNA-binding Zn-ribbon protein involved in translation (DUF1610 family)
MLERLLGDEKLLMEGRSMKKKIRFKVDWGGVPYEADFVSYDELRTWLVDEFVNVMDRLDLGRAKSVKKGGLFGVKWLKDKQKEQDFEALESVNLAKEGEKKPVLEIGCEKDIEKEKEEVLSQEQEHRFECPICGKIVDSRLAMLHLQQRHPDAY